MRIFLILISSWLVAGGIRLLNPNLPKMPVIMVLVGCLLFYILGCYMGGDKK